MISNAPGSQTDALAIDIFGLSTTWDRRFWFKYDLGQNLLVRVRLGTEVRRRICSCISYVFPLFVHALHLCSHCLSIYYSCSLLLCSGAGPPLRSTNLRTLVIQ